jgi:hypothetical protein
MAPVLSIQVLALLISLRAEGVKEGLELRSRQLFVLLNIYPQLDGNLFIKYFKYIIV